jgi:hypothetical protein
MAKRAELVPGQVFGHLTVIELDEEKTRQRRSTHWLCRCVCGQTCSPYVGNLRRGSATSCGCARYENSQASRFRDLSGQRFGSLTAVGLASRQGDALWECTCDCGEVTVVRGSALGGGHTTSCGCRARQALAENRYDWTKHGMARSPEWYSWSAMRARVLNPNHHAYNRYGGRGITICPEWDSFEQFYADMGPRSEGLTLDRIDSDGNYVPGNCRWADWSTQRRNQRRNRPTG